MVPSILAKQSNRSIRVFNNLFNGDKISPWLKEEMGKVLDPPKDELLEGPHTAELQGLEALNAETCAKRTKTPVRFVSTPCSLGALFHACKCNGKGKNKNVEPDADVKKLTQPLLKFLKEHRKLLTFLWVSCASIGCDKYPIITEFL